MNMFMYSHFGDKNHVWLWKRKPNFEADKPMFETRQPKFEIRQVWYCRKIIRKPSIIYKRFSTHPRAKKLGWCGMPARGAKRVGHGSCLRAQSHWWTARGGETESDGAVRGRRAGARVRMYSYDTVLGMEPPGLLIMSFIIFHEFPWTPRRHFGRCGQSCGCCRSHNPEDGRNCEECYDGWTLTTVSRAFRDMTQKYARQQLHLDQGWWWWGEGWWWGDWSEEIAKIIFLRIYILYYY